MNRALLEILADGKFHSGEKLGATLGVSRTAVWKHLAGFAELGVELESRKGKGYRIVGGIELLDEGLIRAGIGARAAECLHTIEIHQLIDSTNLRAMSLALEHCAGGFVCLAEQQNAGRGRRGRDWISPFARNLYLSMTWEFQGGVAALEGLSLAVAVAVARAITAQGVESVRLKWPNDLMVGAEKLGGILIELAGDLAGPCHAVIGIGLNVDMPVAAGIGIDQPWTDLVRQSNGREISRNSLAASLLTELVTVINEFETGGFAVFRQEWEALDALRGQPVILNVGASQIQGRAEGVSDDGALRLLTSAGLQTFSGGEVSVRAGK